MWYGMLLVLCCIYLQANNTDPIDVVIPCTMKDLRTLNFCIEGIKTYGKNVNRVIVVSAERLTYNAEWFDETQYPFTKYDIIFEILKSKKKTEYYLQKDKNRSGWIFQQLLKLYTFLVIPDISSNILVLDADTIFLNPVTFIDDEGNALYNTGTEYNVAYFAHGKRLIPRFQKIYPTHSGITHHMLLQKEALLELFNIVEQTHKQEFWRAFCNVIDPHYLDESAVSEYELYFNFIFDQKRKRHVACRIRELNWKNMPFVNNLQPFKKSGYHYVSCHSYR